jgi:hypothetical protein
MEPDNLIEEETIDLNFGKRSEAHANVRLFNEMLTKEEMAIYYSEHFVPLLKKIFSDAVLENEKYLLVPVMNVETDVEEVVKEVNLVKKDYLAARSLIRELIEARSLRVEQINEALTGKE